MTNRPRNQIAGPQGGEHAGLDAIMPALYGELRRLAGACMQRERPDHTLQTTALVHEAYDFIRPANAVAPSCASASPPACDRRPGSPFSGQPELTLPP